MTPDDCDKIEIKALREVIDARLQAMQTAIDKEAEHLKLRFEQTNQWRAQLDSERGEFLKTAVFHAHEELFKRELELVHQQTAATQRWQDQMTGAMLFMRFGVSAGVIGLLLTLLRMIKLIP